MPWLILIASGAMEAVWATALGKSEGFSRPFPTLLFVVGLALSMAGLGIAMRSIPTPTAYAIWVSIGVLGTVLYAVAFDDHSMSPVKAVLLVTLVGSVIGLKLAD
ncbi:MAG: multidrug efflux SMR transporter [Dehalococcoidia bacterium]